MVGGQKRCIDQLELLWVDDLDGCMRSHREERELRKYWRNRLWVEGRKQLNRRE